MHIMEGYLPPTWCIAWGAVCLPFFFGGLVKIKKIVAENRKTLLILAMVGAYAFVLSALKIPSVTGSSSHPTGTGLGAVLFGPAPMAVLGAIVLLFQAILLAHGGLTTLGANIFSMAIAGPFVSCGVYWLCRKLKLNKLVGVFLACSLGDLFTYCVTSVQLGICLLYTSFLNQPVNLGVGIAAVVGGAAGREHPVDKGGGIAVAGHIEGLAAQVEGTGGAGVIDVLHYFQAYREADLLKIDVYKRQPLTWSGVR